MNSNARSRTVLVFLCLSQGLGCIFGPDPSKGIKVQPRVVPHSSPSPLLGGVSLETPNSLGGASSPQIAAAAAAVRAAMPGAKLPVTIKAPDRGPASVLSTPSISATAPVSTTTPLSNADTTTPTTVADTVPQVTHSDSGTTASPEKLQTILPGQVPRERQVYVSPDRTIYWPIDKPFWLRMATSQEDVSQSFLLTQMATETDENSKDLYKKGIKLEMAGKQFIRWINYLSKGEISYKFIADGGPPVVRITYTTAPRYDSPKQGLVFGRQLSVSLHADDEHSGVRYIGLSTNTEPYSWYAMPFHLLNEGKYEIKYYSVDYVGYASSFETAKFQVDLTPPNTDLVLKNGLDPKVIGPKAYFELQAQDEVAGVKASYYKFNNDVNYHLYVDRISLDALPDGNHIIYYYSEDHVDNRETPKEVLFYLDRSPPMLGHAFLGDLKMKDNVAYVSPRTRVRLDATDEHSKVKRIEYWLDKSTDHKEYREDFQLKATQQLQSVFFQAWDEFDNLSPAKEFKVFVDSRAPVSQHNFTGSVFAQANRVYFVSGKTKITLAAHDDDSGIQNITYQIGDLQSITYKDPFSVTTEGRNLLRYWAVDHVNNQEESHAMLVVVDNTPPDILVVFSNEPGKIRRELPTSPPGPQRTLASSTVSYPPGTSILINATDSLSGVKDIFISVDHEPMRKYQGSFKLMKPKDYQIEVLAVDRVGNEARKTLSVKVEGN